MDLLEAITIIDDLIKGIGDPDNPDVIDALVLAIEAMKVLRHGRSIGQHVDPARLPGETKG